MAAPVREVRATSLVGRLSVPVKYPVSHRMTAARTMPMTTARRALSRGSPLEGADRLVRRAQPGERVRQVDVGRDGRQDGGDAGRDVEAAVDRRQRVLARLHPRDEHTDEGGHRTDGGHDEREDQAVAAEGGRAEDQGGDEHDGVGLEQVRGHAGAVADVVTDVVGDRRGVARVVLGDACLDLADQVGAHVGGLGEDAATDAHEHGEQGGTEAEALEHLRGVALVEQDHDGGAEQAQAHRRHTDRATGAEGDPHAGVTVAVTGGGRRRGRWP